MSASDRGIRTVAVAGSGIAAWSAAAAFAKRVPNVSVAVVPVPGSAASMADLTGGTIPSVHDFHRDIGIDEAHLIASAAGAVRLGSVFEGWTGAGSAYVHAFGRHGVEGGPAAFHHLWRRAGRSGAVAPFDRFSLAAALARAGRFLPAEAVGDAQLAAYSHALQLDPARYCDYLHAYARHLGVAVTAEPLAEVLPGANGISGLRLADGTVLSADLYIDATGTDARLLGVAGEAGWEDWRRWLPCDLLTIEEADSVGATSLLDRVEAMPDGWALTCAHPGGATRVRVWEGGEPSVQAKVRRFAAGRRQRAWIGNVVAIGEAYLTAEPLEAVPLHVVHAHVDRLVASLPDRDFAPVELRQYDRETAEEADRLRDFLILHYATADRLEPFWRAAAATAPPDILAETLALFRERGRLPIRDGETFGRDSWLAVLLGQGVLPRRHDVLAELEDLPETRTRLDALARRIADAVAAAPGGGAMPQ